MAGAPKYSHTELDKAGEILRDSTGSKDEQQWALELLSSWRAAHNRPLNTFNVTLRNRLTATHRKVLVAQRLKRIPTVVDKLHRFPEMRLSRIQDIAGVRAVVGSVDDVRAMCDDYKNNHRLRCKFVREKNYIDHPKKDGYRGVHMIYQYSNPKTPERDGLLVEMQIRTDAQHAWATTVETMGTFLGFSLKSDEGPDDWRKFFALTGSAIAHLEGTQPVPGYESMSAADTFREVARQSQVLRVKEKLVSLRVTMGPISQYKLKDSYFLLTLDPDAKTTTLQPFRKRRFARARAKYLELEESTRGTSKQVVLVSTSSVTQLKNAYPNFFLNTKKFLQILKEIEQRARTS